MSAAASCRRSRRCPRPLAAELRKLSTLPLTWWTLAGTATCGALLGPALAGLPAGPTPASLPTVLVGAAPYLAAVLALLGALPRGHEYAGRQYLTARLACPRPGRGAAQAVAALGLVVVGAVVAVGATALGAGAAGAVASTGHPSTAGTASGWIQVGGWVVAYLAAVGFLTHLLGSLTRRLVPTLTVALLGLLVAPVVLGGLPSVARWLPSAALPELLTAGPSGRGLVLLGLWGAVLTGAGAARRWRADADG
ncbi:ABC transporter permease [Buchananella hordeovulneris]|uniref:ABC transporter permease n=1 Tax=Buchananella hordeovulneris TaxID=52770 RepID=UPI00163B58C0|nr:ABC transporter permease [Buchananella hordeovulneris]